MVNSLQRLEVSYNQPHDRLILILHTQDFSEYRFWITRRALIVFWDILSKLLQSDQKPVQQKQQENKQWKQRIEQEQAQKQPMAEKLSTRVAKHPLGEEPLLLAKITGKAIPGGNFQLRLEDIQGRWIEFGGNSTILLALCQLIEKTLQQAEWNLELTVPGN